MSCGRDGRPGADVDEGGVGRAAQQPIQFVQLAALALPADPPRFAFVPDAPAVQKQEARSAWRRAVAQIETRDAVRRRGDERRVAVGVLGRGVGPVGHQREMKIALRARKVVDLEPFDLLFDRLRRVEQRRHGDERAQMRGNAVAQLQSRQKRRGEAEVDRAIDQRDRGVDGGNGAEDAKQAKNGQADPAAASASSGAARRIAATRAIAAT